MGNKCFVTVVYRNKDMEPVYEKRYSLQDYTEMLRADLLRIISDVEDMVYDLSGNTSKSEWPDKTWNEFCRIKHKLLDKAGEVQRIPDNLMVEPNG